MNTIIAGRIVILAIAASLYFFYDDLYNWNYRREDEKNSRAAKAELRHLEDQIQRYYEIKREGGDPAVMFEDPGYDFDKRSGDVYGPMP